MRSYWRATYEPGQWWLIGGPTSMVVLDPEAERGSVVDALWDGVLLSASITDLLSALTARGLADLPTFAALFWDGDGMRSIIRGPITITDAASGAVVAAGAGVQTWTELSLAGVDRVRLTLGSPVARLQDAGDEPALPLVVGVARVGAVVLDASASAVVWSPQGDPDPATVELDDADAEDADTAPTTLMVPIQDDYSGSEGGRTGPDERSSVDRPVLARVRSSDGAEVPVDRTVLIGRAPLARAEDDPSPHLVPVTSPHRDISRTHLAITIRDQTLWAADLHSTNGTLLIPAGPLAAGRLPAETVRHPPPPVLLVPGEPVPIQIGCRLELGDGITLHIEPPE